VLPAGERIAGQEAGETGGMLAGTHLPRRFSALLRVIRASYIYFLRRPKPTNPSKPVPKKIRVPGSGVVAGVDEPSVMLSNAI